MATTAGRRLRTAVLCGVAAASLALSGCGDADGPTPGPSAGSGTTAAPAPIAAGTLDWAVDNCQYTYSGTMWSRTGWCRQAAGPGLYDFTNTATGAQRLYRIDSNDPVWDYWFDYRENLNYRTAKSDSSAYSIKYGNLWLTPAQYSQAKLDELSRQRASAAEQERQRQQTQAQMAAIQERMIEAGRVWTQPSCNYSYNGCR